MPKTLPLVLSSVCALGAAQNALGLTIEYALDRQPDLVACDRAAYRGARAEAQQCFIALLAKSDDPRIKADAARASSDVRMANTLFQEAIKQYPEDARLRARWGDLFLATHQNNEAAKLFQESLMLDEHYAPALLGLAKVAARGFEEKARDLANEVIEKSPDSSLEAYLLLARASLEDGVLADADESLDKATKVAEKQKLPTLEIDALRASADLLRGKPDSEWTARALKANPGYGDAYAIPAYFYVITRRYREAIALYQRAVDIEPGLYSAHAELGVNLLRENQIDEAYQHLQIAYRGDPFSAPVVNTLRLIDSFKNFVVEEHLPEPSAPPPAVAPGAEPPAKNPGALLRLHKDEAGVLDPYVLDLVKRTIAEYSQRYAFDLKEPVVVELYPEHDDFAVRTSGLPGIGLLGVTFGYLVAMDSPTGRADSDFHWGTTLWHEMAHVFTLEKTKHLVPRWFSEGVSVYEEWTTGPLPGRHIPLAVFKAIKDDKFLPIAELDRGFIRPMYESQVIVSYMQAGLTCEYIALRWGQQALRAMLDEYAAGKDTTAAIEAALKVSPQQFDEDFAGYVQAQVGKAAANLEPWTKAAKEAQQAFLDKDWKSAAAAATRAIDLIPEYVDENSPYLIKARASRELGDEELATATLLDYRRLGGHDPAALLSLAKTLAAKGRNDAAIGVLDDVLMVAPLREEVHAELGDRLLAAGDAKRAVKEYQALLAMNPHDLATAHFRLAKAYLAAEDRAKGREQLLYALEIAPGFREAQQLLLEIVR
ncbi:MAG TPA: tetratricopeptide repeat protein [Gammaproteobacteria bacterium]|nr:tetratricopeptide repeat protein [Gammaproteobacteria bacterium]